MAYAQQLLREHPEKKMSQVGLEWYTPLLLHLDIYSVEGDAHSEAVECLEACGGLQHNELLEEVGTEAIAAVVESPNVPSKL